VCDGVIKEDQGLIREVQAEEKTGVKEEETFDVAAVT
jgi:hypothetical protein